MHCVDWFPTIAELTGYKPTEDLKWDGISQWSALTGSSAPPSERTIYIATGNAHSLRYGDWKLIARANGRNELFCIAKDPYEKSDLASKEPGKVEELSKLLAIERSKDIAELPKDLEGLPH